MPDPDEMDAAFDAPPDDDDADENHRLLRGVSAQAQAHPLNTKGSQQETGRIPGDYDFERDYVSCVVLSPRERLVQLTIRHYRQKPHLLSSRTRITIRHPATPTV
jgi:hypothetical protein